VRRLALFGATVLFPCGFLVVFGFLLIRQDRELAARHDDDQRRAQAIQERQTRLTRLERIKTEASEAYFAGREPDVDFAALIVADAAPAPWSDGGPPPALETCERAEFTAGTLASAIDCYARNVRGATPSQAAWARLMLGRALLRTGDEKRRRQIDRELLSTPFDLLDDQGVPFAFYAADRLLRDPAATPGVANRLRDGNFARKLLSPSAAYLLQSIAKRLGDGGLARAADVALHRANAAESLRADLPGLLPALRRNTPEPVWIEHGPWLVGLAKAPESGKELVVGVASSSLPPHPAAPLAFDRSSRTNIYVASLGLVFLIAASGAYLLWRDVRRDVEIAGMRSQFVSSVSHELKTPLTAIRMFAETLRMRPHGDLPREEYLDTIVHESERLSRLVDNVLDFSKIEQGCKLYRLRPTSAAAILDAVVRVVRYPIEAAGLQLRVSTEGPLPDVHADPDALQQAVLNLLANAIKYSGDRREIELAARTEEGALVIAVRDYGVGIAPEHRQRIFERFYRVPSPENRHVPGAGLGLTLVAHIAAAHGGGIAVESAPGAGSVFFLRLPLERRA
jgi:signal transduction histidine kinase